MVALLLFIWLLEGWFYLIFNPPAQRKQCLKVEAYYFGGYAPKHSPRPPPPASPQKKKCLTEEVFLSATVSNIRLEIYYIHRSYRDFFFGVFMDRDEIKVNNNAKKKKRMRPANVSEQGWQEMARERFLAGATREIPVGQDGPMLENPNPCLKIFAA